MTKNTKLTIFAVIVGLLLVAGFIWMNQAEAQEIGDPPCVDCVVPVTEAVVGSVIYGHQGNQMITTETKRMTVPDGFVMTRVQHPPIFNCTEYPQPDTFELRAVAPVVQRARARVTADRVAIIQEALK